MASAVRDRRHPKDDGAQVAAVRHDRGIEFR
jgi:hypothetical protein